MHISYWKIHIIEFWNIFNVAFSLSRLMLRVVPYQCLNFFLLYIYCPEFLLVKARI